MDEVEPTEDPSLVVEGRRSLASQVYDALLQGILEGVFAPGERLIETDLTARLEVSRTPLREALNRLASEDLLLRLKGGGFEVVSCNRKEIEDVYDVRLVLERHLVELVTKRIADDEIAALRELIEEAEYYSDRGNLDRLGQLHDQFHRAMYAASRNDRLTSILLGLERHAALFRIRVLWSGKSRAAALQDHREIVAAIERRDVCAATALAERHVCRTRDVLLGSIGARSAPDSNPTLRP